MIVFISNKYEKENHHKLGYIFWTWKDYNFETVREGWEKDERKVDRSS